MEKIPPPPSRDDPEDLEGVLVDDQDRWGICTTVSGGKKGKKGKRGGKKCSSGFDDNNGEPNQEAAVVGSCS